VGVSGFMSWFTPKNPLGYLGICPGVSQLYSVLAHRNGAWLLHIGAVQRCNNLLPGLWLRHLPADHV